MKLDPCTALDTPDFRQRLDALAADCPASCLLSLTVDLGPGQKDWLDYLPKEDNYWYWAQPRQEDYRLGLGCAFSLASHGPARFAALQAGFKGLSQSWAHSGDASAFLGFAFADQDGGDLPNALLEVPAVLLETRRGRCRVTFTTLATGVATAPRQWLALLARSASRCNGILRPPPRHLLAEQAWLTRVEAALRDIEAGALAKVVLSRSIKVALAGRAPIPDILAGLVASQPQSTIYAHGQNEKIFLGATPECLARLDHGLVTADALAGTAWQGCSGELAGVKNRHEQQVVVDAVAAALATVCSRLEVGGAPDVLDLPHLSHLRTRLRGQIRPGLDLFHVIQALHPTPAVGGSPTPAALDWLRQHGEERRAWYTGGIGPINAGGDGEVAVALRCALISGMEAELYAGAGIVAGSEPSRELAETAVKLSTLVDVFCRRENPQARSRRTGTR